MARRLANVLEANLPDEYEVVEAWAWMPGDDEFIPDLMVFDTTDEQVRYTGTPHLVVEILSTDLARDMIHKAWKYASAGLQRYWIVNPGDAGELTSDGIPELIEHRAVDAVFVEQGRYQPATTVELDIASDVSVTIDPAIFLD